ncbi:DNA glycosylase [Naematelia encephala]|uniref:Adenine DNA glycosylase n=1 Tax=Naematelia encephala TaxID=71784 RepID=A0A1Y2BCX4_9TREE|nr:DNA glycosylase [Naematelia encephala]
MGNAKYNGRLPEDPAILEKEIDGIGRYTAGAICSMAYGISTPIVDGNIHRLLTRLLAIHAPQTAPGTIKVLWQVAEQLVHRLPQGQGIAGDWNQALMELGSQVCKPVNPDCDACPLQKGCKAYMELSRATEPPSSSSEVCDICTPIPSTMAGSVIPSVTVFPMRKEKKASRVEEEVVGVVEWRGEQGRRWLLTKRPEKGLLAGLFEPPTTPVAASVSAEERLDASLATLSDLLDVSSTDLRKDITPRYIGSIPHIFSHINMTYHIQHLVITTTTPPPISASGQERNAVWLDESGVEHANVGTGVKKVWAEVYGSWGSFEARVKVANKPAKKAKKVDKDPVGGGKVVKKIMMPLMPRKAEL